MLGGAAPAGRRADEGLARRPGDEWQHEEEADRHQHFEPEMSSIAGLHHSKTASQEAASVSSSLSLPPR